MASFVKMQARNGALFGHFRLAQVFHVDFRSTREDKNSKSYRTTQQPVLSPFSNVRRAARVAASNTSSTPSPLKLEHSRYLLAPISRATPSPSCVVTNRNDFLRISSIATGSSRRSFFNPTSMIGTPSQRRVASSIH